MAVLAWTLVILVVYSAQHLRRLDEQLIAAVLLAVAALLAHLWSREHRLGAVLTGLAAIAAVALPLQSVLPRTHLTTAVSLAALIPLLATARPDMWHRPTAPARVVSWVFLALMGFYSLETFVGAVLGAESMMPDPAPIILGMIALGMATERLRPTVVAFAALALYSAPYALSFGDEAVRNWQTAVLCLLIPLAAGILLLSLGATYERHLRRAHDLYTRLSAMH
ncbi:hypothetical protein ABGB12_21630 [Actinocorallia sp. B10E7]|uniref:hypothetical protein n=1 Tax=Actinocorallia sp. B10E7 TaxID=3153558 RepID=UPI00325F08AD